MISLDYLEYQMQNYQRTSCMNKKAGKGEVREHIHTHTSPLAQLKSSYTKQKPFLFDPIQLLLLLAMLLPRI